MNRTLVLMKISLVAKNLFDEKTGEELASIKQHFEAALSDAQLCALVVVAMVLRVFGLAPAPTPGSRSMWPLIGLLMQFLKSLDNPPDTSSRAVPTPLDDMVATGCQQVGTFLEDDLLWQH